VRVEFREISALAAYQPTDSDLKVAVGETCVMYFDFGHVVED